MGEMTEYEVNVHGPTQFMSCGGLYPLEMRVLSNGVRLHI